MNIHILSRELKEKFAAEQTIKCDFRVGDVLEINRKLDNRRHIFQAICIKKHNNGVSSSFTVLNHDANEKDRFEITLPLYNPNLQIKKISTIRKFKKANMSYLTTKFGKKARVPQNHIQNH